MSTAHSIIIANPRHSTDHKAQIIQAELTRLVIEREDPNNVAKLTNKIRLIYKEYTDHMITIAQYLGKLESDQYLNKYAENIAELLHKIKDNLIPNILKRTSSSHEKMGETGTYRSGIKLIANKKRGYGEYDHYSQQSEEGSRVQNQNEGQHRHSVQENIQEKTGYSPHNTPEFSARLAHKKKLQLKKKEPFHLSHDADNPNPLKRRKIAKDSGDNNQQIEEYEEESEEYKNNPEREGGVYTYPPNSGGHEYYHKPQNPHNPNIYGHPQTQGAKSYHHIATPISPQPSTPTAIPNYRTATNSPQIMANYFQVYNFDPFNKGVINRKVQESMRKYGLKGADANVINAMRYGVKEHLSQMLNNLVKISRSRLIPNYLYKKAEIGNRSRIASISQFEGKRGSGMREFEEYEIIYTSNPRSEIQMLQEVMKSKENVQQKHDIIAYKKEDQSTTEEKTGNGGKVQRKRKEKKGGGDNTRFIELKNRMERNQQKKKDEQMKDNTIETFEMFTSTANRLKEGSAKSSSQVSGAALAKSTKEVESRIGMNIYSSKNVVRTINDSNISRRINLRDLIYYLEHHNKYLKSKHLTAAYHAHNKDI